MSESSAISTCTNLPKDLVNLIDEYLLQTCIQCSIRRNIGCPCVYCNNFLCSSCELRNWSVVRSNNLCTMCYRYNVILEMKRLR